MPPGGNAPVGAVRVACGVREGHFTTGFDRPFASAGAIFTNYTLCEGAVVAGACEVDGFLLPVGNYRNVGSGVGCLMCKSC